ncbi:hypothetical protein [Planktotalea arctica]|uniref:hypothetical protein n=1 Tax=Planktotalea arctica TaxID=1481893 RepID=UPI003219EF71
MRIDEIRSNAGILTWSNLSRLVQIPGKRAIIAFPLVGYLLLANDYVVGKISFSEISGENGTFLSGELRMQFIYFGLVLLAACFAWFQWRAPRPTLVARNHLEFREHAFRNWIISDFVNTFFRLETKYNWGKFDDVQFTRHDLNQFVEKAVGNQVSGCEGMEFEEFWFLMTKVNSAEEAKSKSKEFLATLLDAEFDYCQYEKQSEGRLLFLTTIVAYFLISVPSADVFLSVSRTLFS